MKARIVIGSNYGDEAKGTVVARYTKQSENVLNVLTNGGSQRGHSILTEDGSMTFQHFGSGTYHGADSYYSCFFILNPMQFAKEHKSLIRKPLHIYRDKNCRWSTPYDMIFNSITEKSLKRKASCGMGIWNTIKRYNETYCCGFDSFMKRSVESKLYYLNNIKSYYERKMTIPNEWKHIWDSANMIAHFIEDCGYMYDNTSVCDLNDLGYDNIIFENGQGLLLSDTGKDIPDTTPSDTGITYGLRLARKMGIDDSDITAHYVTRPYLTRHGDGFICDGETNLKNISCGLNEDRTNIWNEFQGEFRYGNLDIAGLKQRIENNRQNINYELELTHCDEMDRVSEFSRFFDKVNTYDTPLV